MIDRSTQLYENASRFIPGGVNSPARAWARVGGNPRFIERGLGSKIWDVDGNEYVDYVCSWGALILGHCHTDVMHAAEFALRRGSSFGAPTEIENEAARIVVDAIPSIEMVRFVNSGTEAAMSAIRLARAATGRDLVLKFDGGYHGHDDALLVKAGSGVASFGIADSAGINSRLAQDTLVAPYNDIPGVQGLFAEHGDRIACVIVEPVAGNMGVVPGSLAWLSELRNLTNQCGALLIFDEVISGFRVGSSSAQGMCGFTPDITCLGKIIGGGYPVGAYGASADLMNLVAPLGDMYQAGTLSGNPVAMSAGVATMREMLGAVPRFRDLPAPNYWARSKLSLRQRRAMEDLDRFERETFSDGRYPELRSRTAKLAVGISDAIARTDIACSVNSVTGMLTLFFAPEPPTNMAEASEANHDRFTVFFHAMLEAGIYIPPSPFEAWFVSLAHSETDIERTVSAVENALRKSAS